LDAEVRRHLSWLKALTGDFDESWELLEQARSRFLEVGEKVTIDTVVAAIAADIALLERDSRKMEAVARPGLEVAKLRQDRPWQTQFLCPLADAAVLDGQYERALGLTHEARQTAIETDLHHALAWRAPRARALAGLGDIESAEALARETIELVDGTDFLWGRGEGRVVLADVLAAAGRSEEAAQAAEEGAALFETKGATLLAERAHAQAAAVRRGEPDRRAPLDGT
jgi:ATP/maltotriose-dependent transcriptional regulator MalT